MNSDSAAIRSGEELNTANLGDFLRRAGLGGNLSIEQFPAGSSNLTYLLRLGDSEYVLRRPPFGNTVKTAHDMRREFAVLAKLSKVFEPAPKPVLFCDDQEVIGSEFYLMERRRGLIIRGSIPDELAGSPGVQRSVCRSFVTTLAELHAIDADGAGLGDLGKPVGYCRRQIEGWTSRYEAAKTHELPELETAIKWLNDNTPVESGASLVHNDYKFDNIMLDPGDLTRITAVLDWEMVTVGDPLMDLGTTLGYWMSPDDGEDMLRMPFNPRVLMENIPRTELVEMYAAAAGRRVPDMLFYYAFGTFKIAVIAQQIYARYTKGLTNDRRFAQFDSFVAALGKIAARAIDRGRI